MDDDNLALNYYSDGYASYEGDFGYDDTYAEEISYSFAYEEFDRKYACAKNSSDFYAYVEDWGRCVTDSEDPNDCYANEEDWDVTDLEDPNDSD